MLTFTVAVRGDGACFHLEKTSLKTLKRLVPQSFEGTAKKWREIIKQVVSHNRTCKIRLIVGFRGDEPVVEEMTFRVKDKQ